MDPLTAEQDGQGVCGEAAAGADYAGYRTGDTARIVGAEHAVTVDGVFSSKASKKLDL